MLLCEGESRRRRLRLIVTRNHLWRGLRYFRSPGAKVYRDLEMRHYERMRTYSNFFGCLAAGHFAVGHLTHIVATLRGHFVLGCRRLVMVPGNRAMSGSAAGHLAGRPSRLGKRSFECNDGKQAEECCPSACPPLASFRHYSITVSG